MKTPEQREIAQKNADRLQAEQLAKNGEFTDWFEELYAEANGDAGLIPWGDEHPHPALVEWMSTEERVEGAKAMDPPPRRLVAISNEVRVRVLGSKDMLATVRPRRK